MESKVLKTLVISLIFYLFTGISVSEASLISTKEEIDIGKQAATSLEKQYGLVDNKELQERIARIGSQLVAVSDRKDLPYTFKVLKVAEINALSLPGGPIYLNKGLIDYMPSDDEIAGVLAHELGHIVRRHSIRQMEKSMGLGVLFGVILGDRGGFLQQLAYGAIMAGYSREDEREADRLGFLYAWKAGFNPYGLQIGMKKLATLTERPNYGLFSDHPEPEARIALLKRYAQEAHIQPSVLESKQGALVTEGVWQMPLITETVDGYQPLYRAQFLAGNLWLASQKSSFNGGNFITFIEEDRILIYYDDLLVYTLTAQDALASNMSIADLAENYVQSIKTWADAKTAKF